MPLRVVLLAAECEPWAKTGGLADVVDALARALGRIDGAAEALELPIDVFLPRHRMIPVPEDSPSTPLRVPDPGAPGGSTTVRIVEVEGDGYRLRLVDHPAAFDRDQIYGDHGGDYPDNAWRFGLFCRSALETLRTEARPVDLLHLHDWHACPAAIQRDAWYADDPILGGAAIQVTLHNLAYHGVVPADRLRELGLAPGDAIVPAGATGLDLLQTGIELAELVNTVSQGYAREALTPEYGRGLEGVLRAKGDRFFGILNGIDPRVWDPSGDGDLAAAYSPADLSGKAVCRADLLSRVGLDPADPSPVLGMIGRLDPQKGFDLLAGAAERLVADGARLVILGTGDPALVGELRELAAAHPTGIALLERFDRVIARKIYAGADLFLMPSRFEPCGQGQMISLRYGTPPVVRRTGGLADTIFDIEADPDRGNGFVFEPATPDAFLDACRRAIGFRAADDGRWEQLVERGMAVDFEWRTGSAPRYLEAYRRAVALRTAARA